MTTIAIFTFDTTHHALWAEDVAGELGVPVETAPAPPEAKAKCGISLRASMAHAERLVAAFLEEGIEFGQMEG